MVIDEDDVIFEEQSPWGNITAFVEDDGESVYFYLYGPEGIVPMGESPDDWSVVRKCWVCNRIPVSDEGGLAPAIAEMEAGRAPALPAQYCGHADTPMELNPDQLEVIWFEASDSAALLHEGEVLAVIPPWACPSFGNISGYARDCTAPGFIGLRPLSEVETIINQHVDAATDFWHSWSEEETWQRFMNTRLELLEEHFGKHTRYFAIDGERFPPRALVVFEQGDKVIFVTIGVSILAQPRVELFVDDPELHRRVEIGMAFDRAFVDQMTITRIGSSISAMVSLPWDQLCWIGPGHTVDCNVLTSGDPQSTFDSLFMFDEGLDIPKVNFPKYRDDHTNILWAVPICQSERQFLRDNSASDLIARLAGEGHSWVFQPRRSTIAG